MKTIEHYWKTTLGHFSKETELIDRLWKDVQEAYTSPSRHYHTLHHIYQMLELADQYKAQLKHYNILNLAIFYHDVIYDATQQNNEQKSWEYAKVHLLPLNLSESNLLLLKTSILATKGHENQILLDLNFLLDFDLYILGQPWENYTLYTQQIRKEYAMYPDDLYTAGRIQVLNHFLKAESLYKTSNFIECYEKKARENLTKELHLLNQKTNT